MTSLEFNRHVSEHTGTLKAFAINLTRDMEEAKDLVQETLYRAISSKDKFTEGTNLKAWMYTIMKNIFINNYRRNKKRKTFIDTTDNTYFIDNSRNSVVFNNGESTLFINELNTAINNLQNDYKIPFVMHFRGYKYHEIAVQLDIPIGTVKSRIFLARKELKSRIKQYEN